jgi:hypothetical protein
LAQRLEKNAKGEGDDRTVAHEQADRGKENDPPTVKNLATFLVRFHHGVPLRRLSVLMIQ